MPFPFSELASAVGITLVGCAFSAVDSALASLSAARIDALLDHPETPHKPALRSYRKHPHRSKSTYVVGRALTIPLTAILLFDVVGEVLSGRLQAVCAVLATALLVAPLSDAASTLARSRADRIGPLFATYMRVFEILLYPLAAPLSWGAAILSKKFHPEPEEVSKELINAEVEFIVDQVEKSGAVGAEPAEMIRNVLGFADLCAKDIMIPRSKVESIELHKTLEEVRRIVAESGHSRYPVYDGQLDNTVGILCAKDVFKVESADSIRSLSDALRPEPLFVTETQSLASILQEMRSKRQHLAIVVDEFGGMSGIATLEDVLEKIVGDIRDEHDDAETAPITESGDGRLYASPSVSMGDLSAYLGTEIPLEAHKVQLSDVLAQTSSKPEIGTAIEKHGLQFIVRGIEDGEVQRVEVLRTSAVPPEA